MSLVEIIGPLPLTLAAIAGPFLFINYYMKDANRKERFDWLRASTMAVVLMLIFIIG